MLCEIAGFNEMQTLLIEKVTDESKIQTNRISRVLKANFSS
jgi:hypothetical protein